MGKLNINRWLKSRAYNKARALVSNVISSPSKLLALVGKAQAKVSSNEHRKVNGDGQKGRFGELFGSTAAALRLLKAYAAGSYRDISLESLGLIVASVIYFVMPIDALPDFILALGLSDDAALLAWTLRSVSDDIERFIQWETSQSDTDCDASTAEGSRSTCEVNEPDN